MFHRRGTSEQRLEGGKGANLEDPWERSTAGGGEELYRGLRWKYSWSVCWAELQRLVWLDYSEQGGRWEEKGSHRQQGTRSICESDSLSDWCFKQSLNSGGSDAKKTGQNLFARALQIPLRYASATGLAYSLGFKYSMKAGLGTMDGSDTKSNILIRLDFWYELGCGCSCLDFLGLPIFPSLFLQFPVCQLPHN